MKKLRQFSLLSMVLLLIGLLSACRLTGDYPYKINPANEYAFLESYELLVEDTVIYEIVFSNSFYVSYDYGAITVRFERENDYRELSTWTETLLEDTTLTQVYPVTNTIHQDKITLSKGATEQRFNNTELTIDDGIITEKSINFMTPEGYLFYLFYEQFTVDGNRIYHPKELGSSYELAYIPETFDIDLARYTYNGVKVERRFEGVIYNHSYIYIMPYPLIDRGYRHNYFRELAQQDYTGKNITTINEMMPAIHRDYRLCDETDEVTLCFEFIPSWYYRTVYIDTSQYDEIINFYETYYNGEVIDDTLYYTFNESTFVFTPVNDYQYKIEPMITFDNNE